MATAIVVAPIRVTRDDLVCVGLMCCYTAVNFKDILCLGSADNELLCFTHSICLNPKDKPLKCGMITNTHAGAQIAVSLLCWA